ncbi:MAG TPA: outer membrane lipoprotein carrier protein LolA [Kofleriaceae bacterium]
MIDIIGILTRTWLGMHGPAPAPAHVVATAPLVATPTAGSAATKAAPNANTVVTNVQTFYAGIKQVTAQFRQTVTNSTFGSTKKSDGTVWLMKPGKMRWDYVEKKKSKTTVEKSFISNGKYLYVVEHGNKQVIKKNLENDLMPVAVTFLYGKGNLQAEFNAEIDKTGKYGDKGDIVLKMTPKKPSAQYKNLYLVVAPDNFRVKQSVIIDSSNNTNQFAFYTPDFEKAQKDTIFEFDERSVKNYRIIDADQQQQQQGSAAGSAAPPAPKPAPPLTAPLPPQPAPAPAKK